MQKNIPKKLKAFMKHTRYQLKLNGIKCSLPNLKMVKLGYGSLQCRGWYDGTKLVTATGVPIKQWAYIYIHEYCHFLQDKILNTDTYKLANAEDADEFDNWLINKVDIEQKRRKKIIESIRNMELECEKLSVQLIHANGLSSIINPEWYTKKANSYIFFYSIMHQTRRWYDVPPDHFPEIMDMMPSKFVNDYWKVPRGMKNLVIDNCYIGENK